MNIDAYLRHVDQCEWFDGLDANAMNRVEARVNKTVRDGLPPWYGLMAITEEEMPGELISILEAFADRSYGLLSITEANCDVDEQTYLRFIANGRSYREVADNHGFHGGGIEPMADIANVALSDTDTPARFIAVRWCCDVYETDEYESSGWVLTSPEAFITANERNLFGVTPVEWHYRDGV